jgi:hypothetical protein
MISITEFGRKYPFALLMHVGYILLWWCMLKLVTADHSALDACGRGTIVVYPMLFGIVLSLLYVATLLCFLVFDKSKRGYSYITLSALLMPFLLFFFLV